LDFFIEDIQFVYVIVYTLIFNLGEKNYVSIV